MVSQTVRNQLLSVLSERLSFDELKTLCFRLGVDDEDVPGETRGAKARELVKYIARRRRIGDLLTAGTVMRPDVAWPEIGAEGEDGGAALGPAFFNAPPLPANFIERPEELDALRRAVLAPAGARRGVALTALHGMGGIGKSTLAQALCQEPEVQAAFPDGILWLNMGSDLATLPARMTEAGLALDPDYRPENYATLESGASRLRTALRDQAALIVLDNVWDARQVDPFRMDAPGGRLLFTTRDSGIALAVGAHEVPLDILRPDQAVALLHEWAGRDDPDLPALALRVGYLPLALRVAGARLKEGMSAGEWLDTFQHVSQMRVGRRSTEPQENVLVSIQLSVDRLPEADRRLYHALGIFPQGAPIPVAPIFRLWRGLAPELSDFDCHELLTELSRLQLLRNEHDTEQVILHDLLREYGREALSQGLPAAHATLLAAYNPTSRSWHSVQDDGYLRDALAYHLVGAGRERQLRRLLLDYGWLAARVHTSGPARLLSDFGATPTFREEEDGALLVLERTVRQATHILAQDPDQLAPQLLGRLLATRYAEIETLLDRAAATQARNHEPWLRPFRESLKESPALVRTLVGHTGWIRAVAITPDGRVAVSGADDGTLRVWDLAKGEEQGTLIDHAGTIRSVALTPDGRHAVSGSSEGIVTIWNLASREKVARLIGHSDSIRALAVTPDGRHVISASVDRTLRIWDLAGEGEPVTLVAHNAAVNAVRVTPDGRHAVSGSNDGTIKIWDLGSRKELANLGGHTGWVRAVAITPDGQHIVSGSDDGTLRVWDFATRQEEATVPVQSGSVRSVAVTPDGCCVAFGSDDGMLRLRNLAKAHDMVTLPGHGGRIDCVATTPDGRYAVSGARDRTLKVWDLSVQNQTTLAGHLGGIRSVAITRSGRYAVSGSTDGTLKVWDFPGGEEQGTLTGHGGWVRAVAATMDERYVVSGSDDGTIKVWDLATGQERATLTGHEKAVRALAVTIDGHLIVSGSDDTTVKMWDLATGEERVTFIGHEKPVRALVLTPDGRYLISGSADATLKVWDLATGAERATLAGHRRSVNAVATTPDGSYLVSGSDDGSLKVWDVENGTELHSRMGHRSEVTTVAVMANGRYIVSAGWGGSVRVWDLHRAVRDSGEDSGIAVFRVGIAIHACATAPDDTILAGDAAGRLHFLNLQGVERETGAVETRVHPKKRADDRNG